MLDTTPEPMPETADTITVDPNTIEHQILHGIPVEGATVAEPLSQEAAQAFVNAPDDDACPGDFTSADRAMLTYLYQTAREVQPALEKLFAFVNSLTPEVQEKVQKTAANPLMQRLLGNILGG